MIASQVEELPAAPSEFPALTVAGSVSTSLAAKVQRTWADRPVAERLRVLTALRHLLAMRTDALTHAIAAEPLRTPADVRVSEILPLLAACEFLEHEAVAILAPRIPGRAGRPLWLKDVESEVHRVALGRILVIGPSNYPLFLPGVQVLQALAAGNAVTWKPGRGGRAVALLVAESLVEAGLPPELIQVTGESVADGEAALAPEAAPDKVFFTGSASSGRAILRQLAETATPSVMELSGCASVIVLPEAELDRVAAAIAFGMRLNGSATCMAPRRVLVLGTSAARRDALVARLRAEFATMPPVPLTQEVQRQLIALVEDARAQGAILHGTLASSGEIGQTPVLLAHVTPSMRLAQSDLFAPVLSVLDVPDTAAALAAERACPFALSTSIFGDELTGRQLATRLTIGAVVLNDLIIPTADPRIPFGGRRASGFGVTRGAEGLLEMTAVKTILAQRSTSLRAFAPTGPAHTGLFDGLIRAAHAGTWAQRFAGLRTLTRAARNLKPQPNPDQNLEPPNGV